jgi:ferredoxin-NADP reductase
MAREATEMMVESVTLEVPDSKTIQLRWPEGHNPDFKTGQFITCYWPDELEYKRAYSLSSCALDRGSYEFTVRRNGKMGTRLVDWIKVGHRLMVLPPAGRFLPVYEPDAHLVCIAGGSGVTPFRAFVREATQRGLTTRLTILYSVRTPQDVIFAKEFNELAERNPHFRFQVTCTRAEGDDPWPGRRGRIDTAWVREHADTDEQTWFYACGPNELVESAERIVRTDLNVPKERMKTEKWG